MYFNGSSTIVTTANVTTPVIGTVSLWIYPTFINTFATTHRILGSRDQFELRIANGVLYEDLCIGGGILLGTITANNLYHILVRYDRNTGNANAWLNGTLINNGTGHTVIPVANTLTIGNRTGSAASDRYYGYIDDLRIYQRWISDNEIEDIYGSRGCDFNVNGLLNRWLFLDNAPTVVVSGAGSVKDFMGNLNCSLSIGTPQYSESFINIRTKRTYRKNYIN
jgi:hypothetical protein